VISSPLPDVVLFFVPCFVFREPPSHAPSRRASGSDGSLPRESPQQFRQVPVVVIDKKIDVPRKQSKKEVEAKSALLHFFLFDTNDLEFESFHVSPHAI
jgi:hypothetical protein